MKKKIVSVFVLICMMITMLPATILATEVVMKDVYFELIDQQTGELFEGAVLEQAYYADSQVEAEFEKVSEGKFKVSVDTQNYADEFVICEFDFSEGYRQVGYDMEPIGFWVSNTKDTYTIEVCNTSTGNGEFSFYVWDETNGEYLEGSEFSVYLYEDAVNDASKYVTLVDKAVTEVGFEYAYEDGMFIYDGKKYKDLLIHVNFPFGYTYEGNSIENYASENIWFTVSEIAGHTWDETYAEQYLEDLTLTEKEVFIEFVDAKTGERFKDITFESGFYALDTEVQSDFTMEEVEAGKFKLNLEGKEYKNHTVWAFFECPEGYVFESLDGTTFSDYVDRWFAEGETITIPVVSNLEDDNANPEEEAVLNKETITYEVLDKEKVPVSNIELQVWLSDTVGPNAELTLIYESTESVGEIPIGFNDTSFVYNGEEYGFIIYTCHFPSGYHAYYEPANGYINGISGAYYNVMDLKNADYTWNWILEEDEGTYETEPMEDTFSYKFITADETVVDGTKVTVSLCNEMESTDKVVIAESTSGKGEFTVAHMGDFYFHEDAAYLYVELSYQFPSGYVLSDSDGLTGATVYYSVVDLRSGGREIFWLVEKAKDIVIELPKTDSENDNAIVVLPEEKDEISKDIMEDIIEANKHFRVEIKSNNDVVFSFKAGEMKQVDGKSEYDFGVEIETDYASLKDAPFEEKDFVLRINYNYSGELPGNAEISIPVGNEWIGKMLYYYQILADGTYKYTGEKAVVDENGIYKIHQNHCSDYVISAEAPTEETNDAANGENETNTKNDTTVTSPSTGDLFDNSSPSLHFAVVTGLCILGIFVLSFKTKKVK